MEECLIDNNMGHSFVDVIPADVGIGESSLEVGAKIWLNATDCIGQIVVNFHGS